MYSNSGQRDQGARPHSLLTTFYLLLTTARRRRAFTLLELLVVIVIIAILAGLLAVAVFGALGKAKAVRNRAEISQLEIAVQAFKTKYGSYPPSRLRLCEKFSSYDLSVNAGSGQPNNQLDTDSVAFLQKMFPRIDTSPTGIWQNPGQSPPNPPGSYLPGTFIDWNGDGTYNPPSAAAGHDGSGACTLEGDQVLVWALGGTPNNLGGAPSTQGFTTNPKNPADTTLGAQLNPPFFEFQTSRLVRTMPVYNPANNFLSYLDNYGTTDGSGGYVSGAPYLYFSSYKVSNGYNRYAAGGFMQPPYLGPFGNGLPAFGLPFNYSDCYTASLLSVASAQTFPGGQKVSLSPNAGSGAQSLLNKYGPYMSATSMLLINGQHLPPYSTTQGLPTGTWPFAQSPGSSTFVYLNPNTFQIISAGADGFFGYGTNPSAATVPFWTPSGAPAMVWQPLNPNGTPATLDPQTSPGYDDQSNFTGALLGVGKD
jgi:prepilin-type N-terminal cleavage/methylation domain-containing protein